MLASRAQIVIFFGPGLLRALQRRVHRHDGQQASRLPGPARPGDVGRGVGRAPGPVRRRGRARTSRSGPSTTRSCWSGYGFLEETYFDISYDPIRAPDGSVGGVFCIVTDTTGRVLGERRVRTLSALGSPARRLADQAGLGAEVAEVLGENDADVPFAALYLDDPDDGGELSLAGSSGAPPDAFAGCAAPAGAGRRGRCAPASRAGCRCARRVIRRRRRPRTRRWCCRSPSAPATSACWSSGSAGSWRWTGVRRLPGPGHRADLPGGGQPAGVRAGTPPGRPSWPRWTPPRPTSSPTSATSSVPR